MPLDVQAKSLTNRLVPVLWACQTDVENSRRLILRIESSGRPRGWLLTQSHVPLIP